jgi:hypothetical protein
VSLFGEKEAIDPFHSWRWLLGVKEETAGNVSLVKLLKSNTPVNMEESIFSNISRFFDFTVLRRVSITTLAIVMRVMDLEKKRDGELFNHMIGEGRRHFVESYSNVLYVMVSCNQWHCDAYGADRLKRKSLMWTFRTFSNMNFYVTDIYQFDTNSKLYEWVGEDKQSLLRGLDKGQVNADENIHFASMVMFLEPYHFIAAFCRNEPYLDCFLFALYMRNGSETVGELIEMFDLHYAGLLYAAIRIMEVVQIGNTELYHEIYDDHVPYVCHDRYVNYYIGMTHSQIRQVFDIVDYMVEMYKIRFLFTRMGHYIV